MKIDTAMKIILIIALMLSISSVGYSQDRQIKDIVVYKNPECVCCKKWIKYLKKNNYNVTEKNTRDVFAEKKRLGVPEKISACHTAVIDGYVVEGHVTHRDIKRLLLLRPDIKGIAVPGMPTGTPGMEKGEAREQYNTMSFDKKGKIKVFSQH